MIQKYLIGNFQTYLNLVHTITETSVAPIFILVLVQNFLHLHVFVFEAFSKTSTVENVFKHFWLYDATRNHNQIAWTNISGIVWTKCLPLRVIHVSLSCDQSAFYRFDKRLKEHLKSFSLFISYISCVNSNFVA